MNYSKAPFGDSKNIHTLVYLYTFICSLTCQNVFEVCHVSWADMTVSQTLNTKSETGSSFQDTQFATVSNEGHRGQLRDFPTEEVVYEMESSLSRRSAFVSSIPGMKYNVTVR